MWKTRVQNTVTMNLAFITKRYDTMGGTEQDLFELTRRLAAWGHDIHIYCSEIRKDPAPDVHIHPVPTPPLGRATRLNVLARRGPELAAQGNHDLTISYARVLHQDIIRCGGGIHAAYLQDMEHRLSPTKRFLRNLDPYHRAKQHIENQQYSPGNFKKIIAIAESVKKEILTHYPAIPEHDIAVIYDGVDLDRFTPALRDLHRPRILNSLSIPEKTPILLFVGNAFERKGLSLALEALAKCDQKNPHLIVVGGDPHQDQFKQQAEKLGIGARVHFVGKQSDTAPWYATANALLLPSIHEAFGNVVLESMACGTPVILSTACGAAEILSPPLTDFVFTDQTSTTLAENIDRLLSSTAPLRSTARSQVETYSMDAHARHHETLFRSMT